MRLKENYGSTINNRPVVIIVGYQNYQKKTQYLCVKNQKNKICQIPNLFTTTADSIVCFYIDSKHKENI